MLDSIYGKLADIGIDIARNQYKDNIDEIDLRNSLMSYIESIESLNEICSREEEFDFQSFLDYMGNELQKDVEERIFSPDKNIRKRAREQIVDKVVNYSKAETTESKKRVASFATTAIDIIRNFYKRKIDKKSWFIVDEISDCINEAKDEIIDSIKDNQSIDAYYKLSREGNIGEVENRLNVILNVISLNHPLSPYYGYSMRDDKLISIPKSKEAVKKYPPRVLCSGNVLVGGMSVNAVDEELLNYADRHQLPIVMNVIEAKKMLGDIPDPKQHEAEALVGKNLTRKPKPFPPAFPCQFLVNNAVYLEYIELRTEEILDDGTYIVTNKAQKDCAFRIKLTFNLKDGSNHVNYTITIKDACMKDCLIYSKFMYNASKGGLLSIKMLKNKEELIVGKIEPHEYKCGFDSGDEEIDFLERVCDIEEYYNVSLNAQDNISAEEYGLVLYISDLIRGKEIEKKWKELSITGICNKEFREHIDNMGNSYLAFGAQIKNHVNLLKAEFDLDVYHIWTMAQIKEYNKLVKKMNLMKDDEPIKFVLIAGENGIDIESLQPINFVSRKHMKDNEHSNG